jgi:rubrerythrin
MNFSYLDPRGLIENLLGPLPEPLRIDPEPFELPETWHEFEMELSNFKKEFSQARAEYVKMFSKLQQRHEEVNVLKMMQENINSDDLKERITQMIQECEAQESVQRLSHDCSVSAGKVEAMKKVLLDTNSERYAKFTCFVCMDRLVDLFIDPCGHVICEPCWTRTQNKETCPGCRTRMTGIKKIFSLS